MCMPHWNMLRDKIKDVGLEDWVSHDGETAATQLSDQVNRGEATMMNFDPLIAAHNMILYNALETVGLVLFSADESGNEYCPLCFLNSRRTEDGRCKCDDPNCHAKAPGSIESFDLWVDHAADGAKSFMIEQGWIQT